MTRDELDIYGPPGTGKTTALTHLFVESAQIVGPQRVGAVTYTRAAAEELRTRVAAMLGIRGSSRDLRREMPYVGTIHSMCYALLGGPKLITHEAFKTFCQDFYLEYNTRGLRDEDVESLEGFSFAMDLDAESEGEVLRAIFAVTRHQMLGEPDSDQIERMIARQDVELPWGLIERYGEFFREYTGWKKANNFVDFEDLLEYGQLPLPVRVLLVDECQDNSPLMWSVVNAWEQHVERLYCAGDPWQAIYAFSGADPMLFRGRKGRWVTLRESHRLSALSASIAKGVLIDGGWDDPLFGQWKGVYDGGGGDGTTLILARTGRLLNAESQRLRDEGEPYRYVNGSGPLKSAAGQAFRTLLDLEEGHDVGRVEAEKAAQEVLSTRSRFTFPSPSVSAAEMEAVVGSLERARRAVRGAEYYEAIRQRYGRLGLELTPKTTLSTIHSAKGREADHVRLVESWGTLPSAALEDELGAMQEACVAYVGVSRHRKSLTLIPGQYGLDYPFSFVTEG